VLLYRFVQSGLVNQRYSIVDGTDDRFVDIDVDDLVTVVGEIGCNGRSDVPTPDDTDVYLPASIQPFALRVLTSSDQLILDRLKALLLSA
jgi:hypothetical protein